MGEPVQKYDAGRHARSIMTSPPHWMLAARERLAARLEPALHRSRRTGRPVIAAATAPADPHLDPTALVLASRRETDPWFCVEQAAHGRRAVAALGSIARLEGTGTDRFRAVDSRWREQSE